MSEAEIEHAQSLAAEFHNSKSVKIAFSEEKRLKKKRSISTIAKEAIIKKSFYSPKIDSFNTLMREGSDLENKKLAIERFNEKVNMRNLSKPKRKDVLSLIRKIGDKSLNRRKSRPQKYKSLGNSPAVANMGYGDSPMVRGK